MENQSNSVFLQRLVNYQATSLYSVSFFYLFVDMIIHFQVINDSRNNLS